jgi:hypothetical protein
MITWVEGSVYFTIESLKFLTIRTPVSLSQSHWHCLICRHPSRPYIISQLAYKIMVSNNLRVGAAWWSSTRGGRYYFTGDFVPATKKSIVGICYPSGYYITGDLSLGGTKSRGVPNHRDSGVVFIMNLVMYRLTHSCLITGFPRSVKEHQI